jgi:hypothetical protein
MAGLQDCRKMWMTPKTSRWARTLALLLGLAVATTWTAGVQNQTAPARTFAGLVNELSEGGGEFDTDNLISNEKSYLHVMPALEQGLVTGGAYIGVGPDQNFSYIARVRPSIAFIVDIRRDNLLLHLLFKALFASSRTRVEFLSLLTGRTVPDHVDGWRDASIDKIVAYIDGARQAHTAAADKRLHDAIGRYGVTMSEKEFATIDRFHRAFIDAGLSLQFQSFGREPRSYYPTYRELLLETDRAGRKQSYLASEDDFQFVRALEARDAVVPVVGDLSGTHALAAIAQAMAQRGERLSAFYVSNVEMYLFRNGAFPRYVDNVARLPRTDRSVIIRSVFGGYALPESVPGYYSTSTVQTVNDLVSSFAAGKYRSYSDLLRR